jgi:uncharacterized membrane protein
VSASNDGLVANPAQFQAGAVVLFPFTVTAKVVPPVLIYLEEPLPTTVPARGNANRGWQISGFLVVNLFELGNSIGAIEVNTQNPP